MPKTEVTFPDGTVAEGDAFGEFFVHRPLGQLKKKDYVVTHVSTATCVLRARLKGDATGAARALAFLWARLEREDLRWIVERLRELPDMCEETYPLTKNGDAEGQS